MTAKRAIAAKKLPQAKLSAAKKPAKPKAKATAAKIKLVKKTPAAGTGAGDEAPALGPKVGERCPDFMLATNEGLLSSRDLKGAPFVLYFYPKDDTSGCTAEACDFRDQQPSFKKIKARVIGISKDDLKSHDKFAKKYELPFTLGSDPATKICAAFGVWVEKSMYGRKYMGIERATFLVDAKGVIRAVWRKVSVPGHVAEVLAQVKALG